MKEGRSLSARFSLKTTVSGFGPTCGNTVWLGLVPPTAGCGLELERAILLNRGPRPLLTASVSWNLPSPVVKYSDRPGVDATDASGLPASTGAPRAPGSCAVDSATMTLANHKSIRHATQRATVLPKVTFGDISSTPFDSDHDG